jgi:hypothetical protein
MEGIFVRAEAFNQDVSSWYGFWGIRMTEMFGVGSMH